MDPGPTLGAIVTHYGVLLSPRDQDTTSWSPPITLPSSQGKRSQDPVGIASPTSNYRELTADGGIGPADHCIPLSNRGGKTHTHYCMSLPLPECIMMHLYTRQNKRDKLIPVTTLALNLALVLPSRGTHK